MIYVMSDIHGNKERFDSIMSQIDLTQEDTLYVLGDVIDRFPDGVRILRQLMKMPNVKLLIGNHEYMMLNALDTDLQFSEMGPQQRMTYTYNLSLWYRNGGKVTHNYLKHIRKDIRKEIFTYLQSLPLYYDIEVNGMQYKLVHAAPIDKYGEWDHGHYINEKEFAVWHRIEELLELPDNYTLVFGHTPTIYFQNSNPTSIWYGQNRICIDCGAGYSRADNIQTRLACLRLDDYKEFYSTI